MCGLSNLFRTCYEMACTISNEWGSPTFNCYFHSLVISIRVPNCNKSTHTHSNKNVASIRAESITACWRSERSATYRRKHNICMHACVRNECSNVRMTRAHNSHESNYPTVSCFRFPSLVFGQSIVVGTHRARKFDRSRLIHRAHCTWLFLFEYIGYIYT